MNFHRLLQSFRDAWRGCRHTFENEQNFRLQIIVSVVVIAAIVYFPLYNWEVILLLLLIGWVLTMELLNTALERFADLLKPRLHHYVHSVKDAMAAAVLISSLGSAIIGLIILLPHFVKLLD